MSERSYKIEKLDNFALQGETLRKALQSLAWINRWFGNYQAVIKAIHTIDKTTDKPLTIVDLGCGGGDLMLAVAKSLQKRKIKFAITGIDGNANSLVFAQQHCAKFKEINFLQADILQNNFIVGPCDILISSHFMYHFADEMLVDFLKKNLPAVSRAIIFSELTRSRFAITLFKLSNFLLPISTLAKQDGLLAIKRSLNKKEWLTILQQAGIGTHRLQRVPMFRLLLTIFPIKKV
jgi:2-polyprenyl-3-methyl-5-hydroxy-6-metoxy-1,4-benzoquinol methylase